MIDNDILRKALHVPYALLRTPLAVLDERVVSRYVPRGSLVQTSMARTIDVLDTVAERVLSEPSAPSVPVGGFEPAPHFAPADPLIAAEARHVQPLPDEEREDVEHLAEDLIEAEEEQTFVGELAEDDELRRHQAELRAKHTVEERDEFR